ncbi:MAG: hypothetical protein ACI841_003813 [Planctomycetota bacterium]|jgi:hypothetical protein
MKQSITLSLATRILSVSMLMAAPAWAAAQDDKPAPAAKPKSEALTKIHGIFVAADKNNDGRIEPIEAARNKIRGRDFAAFDHDADRAWSDQEFLLYYRSLLTRAGHKIDKDVQAEANRVLAGRKLVREQADKEAAEANRVADAQAAKKAAAAPQKPKTALDAKSVAQADPNKPTAGVLGKPQAAGDATPATGGDATADSASGDPDTLRDKHAAAQDDLKERFDAAGTGDTETARAASQALLERAQDAQKPEGDDVASADTNDSAAEAATQGAPARTGTESVTSASVPTTSEADVTTTSENTTNDALTRDDAAQQLERSLVILKRMVDQQRLTPRQARDFYALFKGRATTLVAGQEPTAADTSTDEGAVELEPKQIREALATASRRLHVLHVAGALTAAEARAMQGQLEVRAIAAFEARGENLGKDEIAAIRSKATAAPNAREDKAGGAQRTKPEAAGKPATQAKPERTRQGGKPAAKGAKNGKAGASVNKVETKPKAVTRRPKAADGGQETKDAAAKKASGAKPKPARGERGGSTPAKKRTPKAKTSTDKKPKDGRDS